MVRYTDKLDHERTDAKVRPLVIFLVAMFVVIAASFLTTGLIFEFFSQRALSFDAPPSPVQTRDERPTGAQLQVVPGLDLRELRASEEDRLNGYGWVNQGERVVHIPIEKAMDLLVEKGLPARAAE